MANGTPIDYFNFNQPNPPTEDTTDNAVEAPISTSTEEKLPPATELMQEEENPEQRKIAGEAPYVTAGRPDAFTPEVEGGVVDTEGKSNKETNETLPPDNSVPIL